MLKITKITKNILKKIEIFNDPIYGLIDIPSKFIHEIIEHPYFQRLRRISQMGMSYLVYPGAHHTRFHHAIGCVFLMQKAIETLRKKEVSISLEEEEALCIAILLHDIGHGPFSHALEHQIVHTHHEELTLAIMTDLNKQFFGQLDLAIKIFKGEYSKKFMHQLISSQLDMDRLDYLKRDSFFSGVVEGNINAERLIHNLNVKDDKLVLDYKGIYSVEKFIVARRLMYWQVYLHKTGLVAENVLVKIIQRAKVLIQGSIEVPASTNLLHFLKQPITGEDLDMLTLIKFARIDDYDVVAALKQWCDHNDFILSRLSRMIIHRKLPKIEIQDHPFEKNYVKAIEDKVKLKYPSVNEDYDYFVFQGEVKNQAYSAIEEQIRILFKNGETSDLVKASDNLSLEAMTKSIRKHFLAYPKYL